jgi:hypothetical protein
MPRGEKPKRTSKEKEGVYAATTAEGIEITEDELSAEEIDPIKKAEYVEKVAKELKKRVKGIKDKEKREIYLEEIKRLEENGDLDGLLKLDDEIKELIERETRATTTETKTETKRKKETTKTTRKETTGGAGQRFDETIKAPPLQKETISFDARPHISFYAITNPRYINLYKVRALPLWDWLESKDIRKRMALHFILGNEDEVRGFFGELKKEQFIKNLDYEIIPDENRKRLILRVGKEYADLENDMREIMRKIVGGHYGEEELKKFLRAGLITTILQDKSFNWDEIQTRHGDWKIVLEIINTKYSLNDLGKISPGTGKTFTEHLRTQLNVWNEKWGMREGEFLYAFRDSPDKYDTVNQIMERDIEIGEALDKGDFKRFPLTGIKKVQAEATHKRYSFAYSLAEDIYKKAPDFYPHYIKMIHRFPNIIWDYISNYKTESLPEAVPEAEFFADFISNPRWVRK